MLKYVRGDLMEASERMIVHGCNAMGVMGSGVAYFIRRDFPEAYEVYRDRHETSGLNLGEVVWALSKGKVIGNAITQARFGRYKIRYVDYDAIRSSIRIVNEECVRTGIRSVALPKIGAGFGGGDWKIISEIIEQESTDFQAVIYEL
jgi:O-acetyl-ADP-ribose deacetylase (regulator of RNase III)